MKTYTDKQLDELQFSEEYADFIMNHGSRTCGNGDMLLQYMEEQYLFEDFIETLEK